MRMHTLVIRGAERIFSMHRILQVQSPLVQSHVGNARVGEMDAGGALTGSAVSNHTEKLSSGGTHVGNCGHILPLEK